MYIRMRVDCYKEFVQSSCRVIYIYIFFNELFYTLLGGGRLGLAIFVSRSKELFRLTRNRMDYIILRRVIHGAIIATALMIAHNRLRVRLSESKRLSLVKLK